jgi:flagellar protein FliS
MPMTRDQRGLNAYRQTEIQSRTPLELVVMLHDGALRHLRAAKAAIERRDIRARKESVGRLLAILAELQNTLDVERGGDIATSLDELYAFMIRRTMDSVSNNQAGPLSEVERVIVTLREGWLAIATLPPAALAGGEDADSDRPASRTP